MTWLLGRREAAALPAACQEMTPRRPALLAIIAWMSAVTTVRCGACTAGDLAAANIILELCFDDESKGMSVPHTHGRRWQNDITFNEPEMSQCVSNAHAKCGKAPGPPCSPQPYAAHPAYVPMCPVCRLKAGNSATALSPQCLGCLTAGNVTTTLVASACFSGVAAMSSSAVCSGNEKPALKAVGVAVSRAKNDCDCGKAGCASTTTGSTACQAAINPLHALLQVFSAPCAGCVLQQSLYFLSHLMVSQHTVSVVISAADIARARR